MSTLSRRATPQQKQVMRMIEGAVHNAADHHPGWALDRRFASSIAKRAAGTLTSQWGTVLAARPAKAAATSESSIGRLNPDPGMSMVSVETLGDDRGRLLDGNGRIGPAGDTADPRPVRPSIRSAAIQIGILAAQARSNGDTQRLEALIDALRILAGEKVIRPMRGRKTLKEWRP